jgi:thiosulfate dehydrogenase [quinone] large subunit
MHRLVQNMQAIHPHAVSQIPVSPIAKFLFADTRMAWLWLLARLYVSYFWLIAGWAKLTGHSITISSFGQPIPGGAWVFHPNSGMALKGFVMSALEQSQGPAPAVQPWYAAFLQHVVLPNATIFAYVITFGEICVGLGLLFGAFTGIAAIFGFFMNMNYLCAGSISIIPILIPVTLLLVLAWRIAGYYGVDRYLIPLLGTPWTGPLVKKREELAPVGG